MSDERRIIALTRRSSEKARNTHRGGARRSGSGAAPPPDTDLRSQREVVDASSPPHVRGRSSVGGLSPSSAALGWSGIARLLRCAWQSRPQTPGWRHLRWWCLRIWLRVWVLWGDVGWAEVWACDLCQLAPPSLRSAAPVRSCRHPPPKFEISTINLGLLRNQRQ
jgi:hypothetical protein